MKDQVTITALGPDDWPILRDLKLQSLEQEPIAFEDFAEGKERYIQRTENEWRARLDPVNKYRQWWFVRDDATNKYIGCIFVMIKDGIGTIQHVYVNNAYRGRGIGKKLLSFLIEKLRERTDVNRIEIQVLQTQVAAINLYHSLGFEDVKVIKDGAKRGDSTYDEIEMALIINAHERRRESGVK